MAVVFDDDIEEIIEYAVNQENFEKAIEKRKKCAIDYLTLALEFDSRDLDVGVLLKMANMELIENNI